jgi:P-loop containing NTP hydrolase pore-1
MVQHIRSLLGVCGKMPSCLLSIGLGAKAASGGLQKHASRIQADKDAVNTSASTLYHSVQARMMSAAGAMELVALDLKRSGKFIARTLSYEGVEFRRVRQMLSVACTVCMRKFPYLKACMV